MKRRSLMLALVALLVVPGAMISADSYKNFTWRRYKLKFKLPRAWRVTQNNKRQFIAKGSNVVIKIKPYRNRSVSARGVAMYGYRTYSVVRRKKIMLRNYGGAKRDRNRYNLWGSGYVNGRKVYWRIMALVSTRDANNVYCRAWWYANKYNSSKNSNRARKVQYSLRFYGGRINRDNDDNDNGGDSLKSYKWRRYRLRFKMPRNWKVSSNNRRQFIAKGSNVVIKIKPYRNSRTSARGVAMYGYRTYSVVRRKKIMLRNYGSARSNDNKYNLWGSGYVNGRKVYWRIMALVSTRDANNVYCRAWWYANKYNSSKNSEKARKVQHSLKFY